jgi:hypothetical protein
MGKDNLQICAIAGGQIVDGDNRFAFIEKPLDQVRTYEARPSGDQNVPSRDPVFCFLHGDAPLFPAPAGV